MPVDCAELGVVARQKKGISSERKTICLVFSEPPNGKNTAEFWQANDSERIDTSGLRVPLRVSKLRESSYDFERQVCCGRVSVLAE